MALPDYDQLVEHVVRRAWVGALTRHASQHAGPVDVASSPDRPATLHPATHHPAATTHYHLAALHPADFHYQPVTARTLPSAFMNRAVQPPPPLEVPSYSPERTPFPSGYSCPADGGECRGLPGSNATRTNEHAASPPPRTTSRSGVGSYAVQHRRNLQRGARSGGYGVRM